MPFLIPGLILFFKLGHTSSCIWGPICIVAPTPTPTPTLSDKIQHFVHINASKYIVMMLFQRQSDYVPASLLKIRFSKQRSDKFAKCHQNKNSDIRLVACTVQCLQNNLECQNLMFIYPKLPNNLTISGYITSKNTSLWNISNIFDKKNITVQCFCEMNCCYIYDMFLLNKDLYIFWKRQLQCCSQMTTGGRGEITIPSKKTT